MNHTNDAGLNKAASLLATARNSVSRLDALPEDMRPQSVAEMYALQEKLVRELGGRGGFKAGPAAPQMAPVTGMICAPLPKKNFVHSGTSVEVPAGGFVGVEAESAFKLGADLPPPHKDYSEEEIDAAIESAVPLIEVLWSRFNDMKTAGVYCLIGDLQMHGCLVLGEAIEGWQNKSLDSLHVRVTINGAEVFNNPNAPHPAGRVLAPLMWLANDGARARGGLKAGEIVTCGSFCGAIPLKAPAEVVASFPGLNKEIKVSYAAKS